MIYRLKRIYWQLLYRFVVKKSASNEHAKFNIHNTFIMPTKFGWSLIGVTLCLFVLGTNYQNNVILAVCYLLVSILLLAIFHNYFFFTQHEIKLESVDADFENRNLKLRGTIFSQGRYAGGELGLEYSREVFKIALSANANSPQTFQVKLPKYKRGIHKLPVIAVTATYGFGFFYCWSYIIHNKSLVVYPCIERSTAQLHNKTDKEMGSVDASSQLSTSDNLQGIRPYVNTDPIYHVSWKHVAKGQGLVTKDFVEKAGSSGWLKLSDYHHLDIERALKVICYQIQALGKSNATFGLDLGSTKILPNNGNKHLDECLYQLACYGIDTQDQKRTISDPQQS